MYNAFDIKIQISEKTLLKAARAFLIFKSLEEFGEIIKSVPGAEDLEDENFEFKINLIYLTNKEKVEVSDILLNISEVEKVTVENVEIKVGTDNTADKLGNFKTIEKSSEVKSELVKKEISVDNKNEDKKEAVVGKPFLNTITSSSLYSLTP